MSIAAVMSPPRQTLKQRILHAAKATDIPERSTGLWAIQKVNIPKDFNFPHPRTGVWKAIAPGTHTNLWRFVMTPGEKELVMTDAMHELETHLDFMMRARGHVLITGLGLGCAVRGALANPAVDRVTVVERDLTILALVGTTFEGDPRVEIIHDDALDFAKTNRRTFDCAWHDLWSDPDKQERHLQISHSKVMSALFKRVRHFQGAWAMPRSHRRLFRRAFEGRML